MKLTWIEAVSNAIDRLTSRHGSKNFDRQGLIDEELAQIITDTNCRGRTPDQTLSAILQDLRNAGEILFLDDKGNYRLV